RSVQSFPPSRRRALIEFHPIDLALEAREERPPNWRSPFVVLFANRQANELVEREFHPFERVPYPNPEFYDPSDRAILVQALQFRRSILVVASNLLSRIPEIFRGAFLQDRETIDCFFAKLLQKEP